MSSRQELEAKVIEAKECLKALTYVPMDAVTREQAAGEIDRWYTHGPFSIMESWTNGWNELAEKMQSLAHIARMWQEEALYWRNKYMTEQKKES